ncbi:P-loop containing nucleoside triphosphate hydrolase protein [Paraphysoderma sedebokerense]|nr:P-loop containing nucleoside triphosphate hydrolase protein [Paraphysoderma sedebokerense]
MSNQSAGSATSSFQIGVVGKPSAGKSSFLNAVTDANAKVGNFPFTTIKPNQGVAYYPVKCPCKKFGKESLCSPRYGRCEDGQRFVPIRMLDVAGLVPGASNQFLDDLRTASVLIHVVDVSGTTDENGKVTEGYDPTHDIDWLRSEIHSWIYNNLKKNWGGVIRRHQLTKSSATETLHRNLSGYGCPHSIIIKAYDACPSSLRETPLEEWDDSQLSEFVSVFLDTRFPTIYALNKIDLPSAAGNIDKIYRKYSKYQSSIILCSAIAENFIRKLVKAGFLHYKEGTDEVYTADDLPEELKGKIKLKPLDEKSKNRLEKVLDLVLFRYGSTGVQDVIKAAVDSLGVVPVYPVKNIHNFTTGSNSKLVFQDCVLLPANTTVRDFAKMLSPEIDKLYLYAEGVDGKRLGENDVITSQNNIISYKTATQMDVA